MKPLLETIELVSKVKPVMFNQLLKNLIGKQISRKLFHFADNMDSKLILYELVQYV